MPEPASNLDYAVSKDGSHLTDISGSGRPFASPHPHEGRRVLLADHHVMLLDLLRTLIEPEFEVVATVTNANELAEAVDHLEPDIVLLELGLPMMNGLDAGKDLLQRHPQIKLIYVSAEAEAALAVRAFSIGVSAFLLKQDNTVELLHTMRIVRGGGIHLTPLIANGDLTALQNQVDPRPRAGLSDRQMEVVSLLVLGMPMKEVACRLGITPRTVAFHKYSAMSLLGLRANSDLVQFAIQHGLFR